MSCAVALERKPRRSSMRRTTCPACRGTSSGRMSAADAIRLAWPGCSCAVLSCARGWPAAGAAPCVRAGSGRCGGLAGRGPEFVELAAKAVGLILSPSCAALPVGADLFAFPLGIGAQPGQRLLGVGAVPGELLAGWLLLPRRRRPAARPGGRPRLPGPRPGRPGPARLGPLDEPGGLRAGLLDRVLHLLGLPDRLRLLVMADICCGFLACGGGLPGGFAAGRVCVGGGPVRERPGPRSSVPRRHRPPRRVLRVGGTLACLLGPLVGRLNALVGGGADLLELGLGGSRVGGRGEGLAEPGRGSPPAGRPRPAPTAAAPRPSAGPPSSSPAAACGRCLRRCRPARRPGAVAVPARRSPGCAPAARPVGFLAVLPQGAALAAPRRRRPGAPVAVVVEVPLAGRRPWLRPRARRRDAGWLMGPL